jgi:cell wall-associated NlpC family hydrolase
LEGSAIVAEARSWIGTPYLHDGRLKGVGVDCAGLLAACLIDLGVPIDDRRGVGRGDVFEEMMATVRSHADLVEDLDFDPARWRPGDALVFRCRTVFNHMAIYSGSGTMIHSYSDPSVCRVVEHPVDARWMHRLHSVWRYRGAR